jgi:hypothetical protein
MRFSFPLVDVWFLDLVNICKVNVNKFILLKLAIVSAAILFSAFCSAKVDEWSWYYATFVSVNYHESDIRYGLAEIDINNGKITGYLVELRAPDIQIPLSGSISEDGVTIELPTFFPSYAIEFSGKMRVETYENCKYEEIILHYEVPNGEVMVLSKNTGKCP